MYLMYVDESGDAGITRSPTRYFVLSGVVVHELRWNEYLERIIEFRKRMRSKFGLLLRDEIHSAKLLNKPGELVKISRSDRVAIIRHFTNEVAALSDINIINVVVDKHGKDVTYDVLEHAWTALIQRFSNTISHRNFRGPANPDDCGMVLPDQSDVKKITAILRKMRRYNPVPSMFGLGYRNIRIANLVEDPYFKDSALSYYIQIADLASFLLYQKICPSTYARKKSVNGYFTRLHPILCLVASPRDPDGIVRL